MIERNIKIWNTDLFYKKYYSKDNKYTILILHWWWWSSDSWTQVWELLFESWYNVIIPDLPWFWKTKIKKIYDLNSYSKLIEEFITFLNLDKIILWWHSNGWAISINLINRWTLKVERLILNNSAWIRNNKKRNIKRLIINYFSKILKIIFWKTLKKLEKYNFYNKLRENFYKLIWSWDYINVENNIFLKKTYQNMISSDLRSELSNININTLLIRWEKDTYTPISDWNLFKKLIKKSKFIMIKNEKHWIHLSNPEILVNTFLNNI